jgi:hypothetical protein
MKKDDIVFALYCTVAVATTVHAGVEIWKTFRKEKTPVNLTVVSNKKD